MAKIRINLYRDFADAIRRTMASEGYEIAPIKGDDEAAIVSYSKVNRRIITRRPRRILKANAFDSSNHEVGLAKLEPAIRNGRSLSPYMSKTIVDISYSDSLLDNWGIHHFHLGTKLEEGGKFIKRTGDILLCRFDDRHAYFIKILPHGTNINPPWFQKELIEIVHKNWPESIRHAVATGVTGLSPKLDDREVAELRKLNMTLLLDMSDGTVYAPPGVGNTLGLVSTDGSSVTDARFADRIRALTKLVEENIVNDYVQIRENARQLGYRFNEPVSFVLAKTLPDVYWDILEPNSRFRFRIWSNDLSVARLDKTPLLTGGLQMTNVKERYCFSIGNISCQQPCHVV